MGNQEFTKPGEGPITLSLIFFSFVSILGGITHGYHTGVLNNPRYTITNCTEYDLPDSEQTFSLPPCFRTEDALWGTIVGMYAIGGLLGSLAAGGVADRIGRKYLILTNNFFFISGALFVAVAVNEAMMIIGRLLVGIGGGVSTVVIPLYLNEISPSNYRGALGILNQLSFTIGLALSQILGLFLSYVPGWRWLIGISCFINILQIILIFFAPQTPPWLVMRNRSEQAFEILKNIRGPLAKQSSTGEFEMMLEGQKKNLAEPKLTLSSFWSNRLLLKPLIIAVALQVSQQLSGINAVFYYSTDIFIQYDPDLAEMLTVSVGILNIILTIISGFLVDRVGRRPLLLIGEFGMIVTGILYTIAFSQNIGWLLLLCTYSYISFFGISLGPVIFIVLNEIFPTNAVATASSIALPFNWTFNYLVGQLFPLMSTGLGSYAFLPFAFFLSLSFVFIFKTIPETKGKTLEEIRKEMFVN